ncbi:MAG: hypothetical protein V7641_2325 [Blastocatellia bacterium]
MTPDGKNQDSHAESEKPQGTSVAGNVGDDDNSESIKGMIRIKDLRNLVRSIRKYFIPALLIGLVLAVFGEWLSEYVGQQKEFHFSEFVGRFLILFVKDAGIALSVSAIAVFGYERIKHAGPELEQLSRLEGELLSLNKARRSLDEARNKLQDTELLQARISGLSTQIKEQENNLKETLNVNFDLAMKLKAIIDNLAILKSGDTYNQCISALQFIFATELGGEAFCNSIRELIEAAHELQMTGRNAQDNNAQEVTRELQMTGRNATDIQAYLGFLGWLIEQVPYSYADGLSLFVQRSTAKFTVKVPSAERIASKLVSIYMSLMEEGDEYWAVTNILSWDAGESQSFRDAVTKACCERGVKSRRILNLCSYEKKRPTLSESEKEKAQNKIKMHVDLQTAAPGNYEVRYFSEKELEKVTKNYWEKGRLETTGFGLFVHKPNSARKDKIIRAEDQFASEISFDRNVDEYRKRFKTMWEEASREKPPSL